MTSARKPFISIQNVSRHYPAGDEILKALDNVSLDIFQGEFVAIMGQSGSGKTTLMNMLGCLDRPTKGSYELDGHEVSSLSLDERALLRSQTFGFIYQRYNLLESATAAENVELPAIYAGVHKTERKERARSLLDRLGLKDRYNNKPNALSGGQQQRVAIARALVNNPSIILADEPTGALDSHSGQEVMSLLCRLHEEGQTVIIITHDERVADYANRKIRLADGKIIEDTGPSEIGTVEKERHKKTNPEVVAELQESVKMAARSLRMNMFRTMLTLLGIIIGVTSVVVMLAVGDGSKQKVLDQITAMGTNLLIVRPGAPNIRHGDEIATLTLDDANALIGTPNVGAIVPQRNKSFTIRRGNVDVTTSVTGTNQYQPVANNWPIVKGTGISEQDYNRMAPVAVLGKTTANNLFPYGEDPIGKTILIKNIPFEVVGIMGEKGASPFGSDQDDVVFIPLTTGFVRLFGKAFLGNILIRVDNLAQVGQTQEKIQNIIMERHKIEDFNVRNMAQFIQMASETQNTLKILLAAVAAISLFVGGIGVMNIMLVSVTERTREIGVRMATGARTKDILIQFLTEAVVVCLTGGIVGVALGVGGALILNACGIRAIVTIAPLLLSFFCAVSTGVLFGYLPARKAAYLDPVVALASE
ncbi:MAG: MacB family efflux pump subunit [Alphaproteobacteria bacterium]|nr:MacB family efflux pump subunit [Alphaproteobacteria bacterium]